MISDRKKSQPSKLLDFFFREEFGATLQLHAEHALKGEWVTFHRQATAERSTVDERQTDQEAENIQELLAQALAPRCRLAARARLMGNYRGVRARDCQERRRFRSVHR